MRRPNAMTRNETAKMDKSEDNAGAIEPRRRTYNTKAMRERKARIIAATLALLEEGGINAATIRSVSQNAGVALRTLYLHFENREDMIGQAIKDFFYTSINADGHDNPPETLADVLDRFDRLSVITMGKRAYSQELAPVYFSSNLDKGIQEILRDIALSHVTPFLDNIVQAQKPPFSPAQYAFFQSQIANLEYAIIDNALSEDSSQESLAIRLKVGVLAFIVGYLKAPPQELSDTLHQLQASYAG